MERVIRVLENLAEENMGLSFLMWEDKDIKDERHDTCHQNIKLWNFSVVRTTGQK